MHFKTLKIHSDVRVMLASFEGSGFGSREHHVIITTSLTGEPFARQLKSVEDAIEALTVLGSRPVFVRYFLSDVANQAELVRPRRDCAVSVIGQAPLDGSKVAAWVYLADGEAPRSLGHGLWAMERGSYTHLWQGDALGQGLDSHAATEALLEKLRHDLDLRGCSLADNCVRTWFMVHDIDRNYAGLVKGRNKLFDRCGLTVDTHFIASTGIGGDPASAGDVLTMNAYSVAGLREGQTGFLYAPENMNRTIDYGVAFERGTTVDYADRRHIFISGTASIDTKGEVMHVGDVAAQTRRALDNILALLDEAEAGWEDVGHLLVYLRDPADHDVVKAILDETLPEIPRVIVHAPVCRPKWLIEMECMALSPKGKPEYAPY